MWPPALCPPNSSTPQLLKGTQLLGCALITDRGFCRDLAAKYAKAGILSPREWCEANNVLFLWPFTDDDDVGLVYDPTTHRLNIVPKDEAKVRGNMFNRPGVAGAVL